jgi:hypothetical protein
MGKIANDKYYTEDSLAEFCVNTTFEIIGSDWDRIIEPSAGAGAFLKYLPETALAYDILPEADNIQEADYRTVELPYMERSLVIGNPPFGRANKLSVQFIKASLKHSDYVAFIQPISQLDQNRTMKDTELLYSVDLGPVRYSGKLVHCCFNIYHKCVGGHKNDFTIPGVIQCRHIFKTGCQKHSKDILNYPWDFRIAAWGNIRLLNENENATNEIVLEVEPFIKDWIHNKLKNCNYQSLLSCVSTPNLPAWRLKKWLFEEWEEEARLNESILAG